MTVIVAARTKADGVVIAADSQTVSGWEKKIAERSKLWKGGEQYALGAAGCVRTSQVVKHYTTWPKHRPDEDTDLETFLVKSIVPAIRTATKDAGIVKNDSGVEHVHMELVVAWGDNLAEVASNGAVVVPRTGRLAIGSGYAEALGYLGDAGPWTITQIVEAARRATLSAHGCDGAIDYITTKSLEVVRG